MDSDSARFWTYTLWDGAIARYFVRQTDLTAGNG